MSIIKCPVCREQVSTMAGTCPHCNTKISGQLRTCPNCGSYCLITQETCPECGSKLDKAPAPPSPKEEKKSEPESHPTRRKIWKVVVVLVVTIIFLMLCGVGYHYYKLQRMQQKEQADYERLHDVTNPEFYLQFLFDYPHSKYYDEINKRMLVLQAEAEDWKKLQKNTNRANISRFMQDHPRSIRIKICEDMLDSIDWKEAQAIDSEEAMTDYLTKHPTGLFANEAAEKKNTLLLTKVTPEERATIRGTLESFFSKAIANQDIEAVRQAIPDTTIYFCGKQDANAEAIVQYAREKMANDVIGLHYTIEQKMNVHRKTLPDGNVGFSVEVKVQETISRSDTSKPTSNHYRVNALLNQEQKIVRLNIVKD